jgi:transposase
MEYFALDAHRRYSFASTESLEGIKRTETRIEHAPGANRQFLGKFECGSPVAVVTAGNWCWIIGEVVFTRLWTRLKNRIHATLAKYGLRIEKSSGAFNKKARQELGRYLEKCPVHTRYATEFVLKQLDSVMGRIGSLERRMQEVFSATEEIELLMNLPGVGFILAVVFFSELGDVERFFLHLISRPTRRRLPGVHATGGEVCLGPLRSDMNRYLKWAFVEAPNVSASNPSVL